MVARAAGRAGVRVSDRYWEGRYERYGRGPMLDMLDYHIPPMFTLPAGADLFISPKKEEKLMIVSHSNPAIETLLRQQTQLTSDLSATRGELTGAEHQLAVSTLRRDTVAATAAKCEAALKAHGAALKKLGYKAPAGEK